MTTTITNDQEQCFVAMRLLGIHPSTIQPKPPSNVCDALLPLGPKQWLLITNNCGQFTMHILEDATDTEAWAYFDSLKPAGVGSKNARCVMLDTKVPERN